jgi:hypothetical protein
MVDEGCRVWCELIWIWSGGRCWLEIELEGAVGASNLSVVMEMPPSPLPLVAPSRAPSMHGASELIVALIWWTPVAGVTTGATELTVELVWWTPVAGVEAGAGGMGSPGRSPQRRGSLSSILQVK